MVHTLECLKLKTLTLSSVGGDVGQLARSRFAE